MLGQERLDLVLCRPDEAQFQVSFLVQRSKSLQQIRNTLSQTHHAHVDDSKDIVLLVDGAELTQVDPEGHSSELLFPDSPRDEGVANKPGWHENTVAFFVLQKLSLNRYRIDLSVRNSPDSVLLGKDLVLYFDMGR